MRKLFNRVVEWAWSTSVMEKDGAKLYIYNVCGQVYRIVYVSPAGYAYRVPRDQVGEIFGLQPYDIVARLADREIVK